MPLGDKEGRMKGKGRKMRCSVGDNEDMEKEEKEGYIYS